MDSIQVLLVCFSVFVFSKGTEKMLPRGVSLAQRPMYDSLQDFTCFDGTLRLPFGFVNDDYCDCQDGSDEPGTSACPNGRFHCHNVGFVSLDLPASRVNDGVCDCCDASDEYLSGNCTNICHMLGAEAKKAAEKEAEIASQGNELRLQMVAAGKDIRQQKQERLSALESDKLEATRLKEEASRLKQIAESAEFEAMEVYRIRKEEIKAAEEKQEKEKMEQEARDTFNQLDSNHDNVLQTEELIVKEFFDQNKDGQISEELNVFFNTKTDVSWDAFFEVWPKIKPFFILGKEQSTTESDQVHQSVNQEVIGVPLDHNLPVTEAPQYLNDKDESFSLEPELEERQDIEPKLDDFVEQEPDEEEVELDKQDDEEEQKEEVEESKSEDEYDEYTMKLIDDANKARAHFESAERSLQDVERELTRLKDSLEKDYGTEDEFIPLDGQCYSYSDREYTYKLCPFDQVVQMGKSGGSETRLGVWAGWVEDSQHKVMLYDKGQTCWNGPQRSTKVSLLCGLETAVIGASEPNKCEYELFFQTPAACKVATIPPPADKHDEF